MGVSSSSQKAMGRGIKGRIDGARESINSHSITESDIYPLEEYQ
jgi:hypothetical protein